jgi:hypothetical protein
MAQEYKPGQIVPQSGVYRITHDPQHADMPHEVTVIKGRRFPTCRHWRGSASSWSTRQSTSMKFRTCTRRRLSALGTEAVTDNPDPAPARRPRRARCGARPRLRPPGTSATSIAVAACNRCGSGSNRTAPQEAVATGAMRT